MTTEQSLITRDDASFGVQFTAEAIDQKRSALECAALIGKVTDAAENEMATVAQFEIARVLKDVEEARKILKQPVLDYGRKIDACAKDFLEDLKAEQLRIAQLVGDFQQLEIAKNKAAEALRVQELDEIQRRAQEDMKHATSLEEIDMIQARANQEAQAVPLVIPAKVAGQTVREDWDITIVDVWALARAHPMCVKVTPMLSEIRSLLDAGVTPCGVTATRVVKAGVRLGKEREAVNV